jgi:hypothetical protein
MVKSYDYPDYERDTEIKNNLKTELTNEEKYFVAR